LADGSWGGLGGGAWQAAGCDGEYGAQIVAAVGRQLETRYGKGFGDKI